MPTINVLHLCLTLDTGGLERVVVNLSNAQIGGDAVHPHICTVGKTTGQVLPATRAAGVDWTELAGPPHFAFRIAWKLSRLLKRTHIDCIHAHGTQPLVYALIGGMGRSTPIVFTKHNSYEDLDFFIRRPFFNSLACSRVSAFVGVSEAATALLRTVFKPAAERCLTQINGTAPLPDAALRDWSDQASTRPILATVCRLSPEKDLATMLHALAKVRTAVPGAELWLIGDGPEREALTALTAELGLQKAVQFMGFQQHVPELLQQAQVFVNSSLTEGISISILEAMSVGLPVVATAVGGTPSIVHEKRTGLLVPPRDPDALAQALVKLLRDRAMCQEFGQAARNDVQRLWSLDRMAERYLQLYRQAIPAAPRHGGQTAAAF